MQESVTSGVVMDKKAVSRIFFLDNLKAFLAVIVVIHHAGQPYGPGGGWWIAQEPLEPISFMVLGTFFAVNMSFFMGLFFMISAYFMPASYDKKGAARFLEDKLIRYGIPIAIFLLIVFPVMQWLIYYQGTMTISDYYLSLYLDPGIAFKGGPGITMGHLWFLEQLMVFAAFYVIWRSIAARIANKPARKMKIPGNHAIGVFALLLGVSMFIARIWSPINHWTPWLVLEPAHYTGYVALFIAGILAYRNGWLESMDASLYRVWGKAVVICLIALPVLYGVFGDGLLVTGGPTIASFIGSQWEAFMCVAMCISLIWLFKNRHNTTSKLSKAMADSSFTVYLIHVPVIVFLQFLLIGVDIHPLMKLAIVCAIGVPASFLISHYVIRKIPYFNGVF